MRQFDLAVSVLKQIAFTAVKYAQPTLRQGRRVMRRVYAQARGLDTLIFGRSDIDVRALEQLQDPSQLRTVGWIMGRLSELQEPELEPLQQIVELIETLRGGDWDWLTGRPDGDLAVPRPHEVMAALNRLRGARFVAASEERS